MKRQRDVLAATPPRPRRGRRRRRGCGRGRGAGAIFGAAEEGAG
ncbi:hypothetical protein AB5I41_17650 [Sphingomonas sp. MMS24-JH45]